MYLIFIFISSPFVSSYQPQRLPMLPQSLFSSIFHLCSLISFNLLSPLDLPLRLLSPPNVFYPPLSTPLLSYPLLLRLSFELISSPLLFPHLITSHSKFAHLFFSPFVNIFTNFHHISLTDHRSSSSLHFQLKNIASDPEQTYRQNNFLVISMIFNNRIISYY